MQDENKNVRISSLKDVDILVVEDSPTQRMKLQYLLEDNDVNVRAAKNGKEALELLSDFKPDVVLTDIVMPEMDGYELCKRMKETNELKHIPVILLTALTDPQDVIRGLKVGADNFIPKPFSDEFLLSRINQLLINDQMRSARISGMGIEIYFAGEKHYITSEKMQIIDLLLSTYENAVAKNNELIAANEKLNEFKETLEAKNSELEKFNTEKNYFIGMMAHDIRNPLGSIYNFAELLEDEFSDGMNKSQVDFVNIIKSSANLLLNMVNELLDISKIESGNLKIKKREEDLVEFVKQNITKNKYLAERKKIKISFDCDQDELIAAFDPERIDQVLGNLLSNAIKYSENDSKIEVKLKTQKDKVVFSVKDQGVGVPDSEQDKLFKPFSKTSAKTTAGESSTGLGLFTCKKIIEAHEGTIDVESIKGEGSTFYFTLPVKVKLKNKQPTEQLADAYMDQLKGKKILFVDDVDMNYSYFKGSVKKLPVEIEWAEDGIQAIKKCKEKEFDMIFMDIHLPELNGFETTKAIRKFNQDVIIVGQTAYSMEGMEKEVIEAGCNDYISMPIRPAQFIRIIGKHLT